MSLRLALVWRVVESEPSVLPLPEGVAAGEAFRKLTWSMPGKSQDGQNLLLNREAQFPLEELYHSGEMWVSALRPLIEAGATLHIQLLPVTEKKKEGKLYRCGDCGEYFPTVAGQGIPARDVEHVLCPDCAEG